MEDWKKSLDDGKLVAMVAMDLSKTFDSLPHSLLMSKLRAYMVYNCRQMQMRVFTGLSYREISAGKGCRWIVRLGVKSTRCTPHGSVRGPLCLFEERQQVFFGVLPLPNIFDLPENTKLHCTREQHSRLALEVLDRAFTKRFWSQVQTITRPTL